jgi:hypothetical protein
MCGEQIMIVTSSLSQHIVSHFLIDGGSEHMNTEDMAKFDLKDVQRKKDAAIARLADLDRQRAEVTQEINELAITERTVARMLSVDLPEPTAPVRLPELATRKKPVGIPSIYVMTLTVLRERGAHWIEGSDLIEAIRDRWWPTAARAEIAPTLWRLSKMNKLTKNGTKYGLPPGAPRALRELGEPGSVSVQ